MYFIGVDLGGTKIATALINDKGDVIKRDKRLTEAHKGPGYIFDNIKKSIYAVTQDVTLDKVKGIGLGIPGLVDLDRGASRFAGNLGWSNIPILDEFKRAFNVPVFMDNDVRVAALGEKKFGAGQGVASLIYITVGTGVGSGIIMEEKLYRGINYSAGEIGHTTVFKDGPYCYCGNRGCLELYASAPGIARRAREYMRAGHYTLMMALVEGDISKITAEIVSRAADQGDRLALMIMEETAEILGIGIANCINILNLNKVIVGGGISLAGEKLFAPLRKTVEKRVMQSNAENVAVIPAKLGDCSGMIGAAVLAMESLGCI